MWQFLTEMAIGGAALGMASHMGPLGFVVGLVIAVMAFGFAFDIYRTEYRAR